MSYKSEIENARRTTSELMTWLNRQRDRLLTADLTYAKNSLNRLGRTLDEVERKAKSAERRAEKK